MGERPKREITVPAKMGIEERKIWADVEKFKANKLAEAFVKIAGEYKEYMLSATWRTTLPAYILMMIIFLSVTWLTRIGIVAGETFAFTAGTVIGYIISLLTQRR